MWAARAVCFQATALPWAPRGGGHIRHAVALLARELRLPAPQPRHTHPMAPKHGPAEHGRPSGRACSRKHIVAWPLLAKYYWIPSLEHTGPLPVRSLACGIGQSVTYMLAPDHDSAVCSLVCSPVFLGLSFLICEVDMIVLTL